MKPTMQNVLKTCADKGLINTVKAYDMIDQLDELFEKPTDSPEPAVTPDVEYRCWHRHFQGRPVDRFFVYHPEEQCVYGTRELHNEGFISLDDAIEVLDTIESTGFTDLEVGCFMGNEWVALWAHGEQVGHTPSNEYESFGSW